MGAAMIPLLIALVLLALVWFVLRTAFANHPQQVRIVIDVLFLVDIVVVLIARWAGVL
jgi:hypothetical protein